MRSILPTVLTALLLAACATDDDPSRDTSSYAPEPKRKAMEEAPEIVEPEAYLAFLDQLRDDIDDGKPRYLTSSEKRRFETLASSLERRLAGVDDIDMLDEDDRRAVFNDSQELWATVVGDERDQVICSRTHRVGTHFRETRCRTLDQIRADQERARSYLDVMTRTNPAAIPSNGGIN